MAQLDTFLFQDTKLWDRNVHKPNVGVDSYRGLNGTIPSGGTYAPHQYFPPRIVYPHNYGVQNNPRMQFMPVHYLMTVLSWL